MLPVGHLGRLLTAGLAILVATGMVACSPPEERSAAFLANAQKLFDEQKYVEAEIEAKNAAQVEPKNAAARYLLALIAEQNDKPRDMLANLQLAVSADPNLVDARVKLGLLYSFGQAYDEAAEQAAAAMALAPDDAGVRTLNAGVLLQQGKTAEALANVDKALAADPTYVRAISLKASMLADEQPDQALAVLDAAVGRLSTADAASLRRMKLLILQRQQRTADVERELAALARDLPEERGYAMELARLYESQGRVDEAENVMRSMVAGPGSDTQSKINLAVFLTQARTPAAAEDALKAFVEAQPDSQPLRLALSEFYEYQNRRDDAVASYGQVIAMDPKSPQGLAARNRLAVLRLKDRDLKGAGQLVDGILADAPDNPEALLVRAGLLFIDRRYGDVVTALRGVLRREPANESALLLMARAHVQAGDVALAKDAYRRLLEANPRNTEGAREFIELSQESKSLDDPEELLRRLTAKDPANLEAGALLTDVLLLQGDLAAAETEARRIAALTDPRGIGAFELGRVLATQKRYDDAAKAYLEALGRNPDNLTILQALAASLLAQDKKAAAIAMLREQVRTNPSGSNARLLLGSVLAGEKSGSPETLSLFESVVRDQPADPAGYLAIASLYPDDPAARIGAFRRGLAAAPGNPELGLALAAEYWLSGQIDAAITIYEELLAANPGRLDVMNELAAALLDYRYQEPASLRRALELADQLAGTTNPLVMDTVGWAYYRAGKTAEAVGYLERAAAGASDVPAIHYHLGMAYLASGNRPGARQALAKAVAAPGADFPGLAEARETLAELD